LYELEQVVSLIPSLEVRTNVLYLLRKTLASFHFPRTMTSVVLLRPHVNLVSCTALSYTFAMQILRRALRIHRCTISQWLSNFDLGPIKDRGTEAEAKLQCAAFDSNRSKGFRHVSFELWSLLPFVNL